MKKYRLKPEAVQFFDKKYSRDVKSLHYWEDLKISLNALEECEKIYLTYGIKNNESMTDVCGWGNDKQKSEFCFTINVLDTSYSDYKILSNELIMRDLMNKVQATINNFVHDKLKG